MRDNHKCVCVCVLLGVKWIDYSLLYTHMSDLPNVHFIACADAFASSRLNWTMAGIAIACRRDEMHC